jgi:hypothetical protein
VGKTRGSSFVWCVSVVDFVRYGVTLFLDPTDRRMENETKKLQGVMDRGRSAEGHPKKKKV